MFAPKDTQTYRPAAIENFALHYRYVLTAEKKKGKYSFKLPKTMRMPVEGQKIIPQFKARQDAQIKALERFYTVRMVEAAVDWRLIVGLGAEHVQETNMTLHHIYGIPYIPGSAVKGVLNYLAEVEDTDKSQETLREVIFGTQDRKGGVIFLDAFPVSDVTFATDIMNPHYPEYYGGDSYPADDQNPNPVTFLTVEKTTFRFVLLTKDTNTGVLTQVVTWLKEAFECTGFGAKTAVGYGYFRDVHEIPDASGNSDQTSPTIAFSEKPEVQLSGVNALCAELATLLNVNRSYEIYNQELEKLSGDEQIQLANALKIYWQSIGKWKGGSQNQKEKVRRLKAILGIA